MRNLGVTEADLILVDLIVQTIKRGRDADRRILILGEQIQDALSVVDLDIYRASVGFTDHCQDQQAMQAVLIQEQ